jgi:hypothetical protein
MTTNNETKTQAATQPPEPRAEQTNLSCRYGSIGIEAVAAAVQYAGGGKNPAYAPAAQQRIELRFVEAAA